LSGRFALPALFIFNSIESIADILWWGGGCLRLKKFGVSVITQLTQDSSLKRHHLGEPKVITSRIFAIKLVMPKRHKSMTGC
jgi:hypothetical protein